MRTVELTGRRQLNRQSGNWKSAMTSRYRRSGPTSCSAAGGPSPLRRKTMMCSKSIRVKQSDTAAKPHTMRVSGWSSRNARVNDHPVIVPAIASAMQKAHLPHFSDLHEIRLAAPHAPQPEEVRSFITSPIQQLFAAVLFVT